MSLRKKTHTDFLSLKRSRSGYNGNITKVADKLAEMAELDLSSLNIRVVENLVKSITTSETKYLSTLEEANDFLSKEENADTLLDEEEATVEQFQLTVSDVRESAANLISLKTSAKNLRKLTDAVKAVRDAFTMRPEADQSAGLHSLQSSYAAILNEWDEGNHDDDHPLRNMISECGSHITQLICEMAGTRDATPVSSHDRSTSSFASCDFPRRMENKLPTIEVPTFSGDIMKWATFWAAFQSGVGTKDHLSNTTKLIYLRKAIKDPECQTLLTDPREDDDLYQSIVKELHECFDRTKEVHRNLVQQLIRLTSIKETREEIRRLMSTVKSILSSLKRTGTYCLDTFITSIIYALVPTRMKTLWEQHTKKSK